MCTELSVTELLNLPHLALIFINHTGLNCTEICPECQPIILFFSFGPERPEYVLNSEIGP